MYRLTLRLAALVFVLLSSLALDKANADPNCPWKYYSGSCIQVITYAINPNNGTCCVYPNPCVVPDGWVKSTDTCPSGS